MVLAIVLLMFAVFSPVVISTAVFAQDSVAADTPTPEPPTPTSVPPTATSVPPTATETPVVPTPTPRPVPIPEPVTVILFGTGLAALSATLATRRKKDN